MFDNLTERLQNIISNAQNKELNDDNIQEAIREIRRAFLEADVNLKVVKAFISTIKDKVIGEKLLEGVNPSQQLIKIVYDEIVNILGKNNTPLNLDNKPSLIMLLGLQGSGKTTTAVKLANKLKKQGKNPLLVACDIYRPAAISQLITLGKEIDCEVYTLAENNSVQNIVQNAINYAREKNYDVIILDTAGRLQIDTDMMAELMLIDKLYAPQEKLLVIDTMTGQESVNVADNFNVQIGITGLILTKTDGDSRGGAALSIVHCTGKPIKFIGSGEKLDMLEDFYPDRIASRILGMGDIVSFVQKAQEVFDEKEALKMQEKLSTSNFNYNDFINMQNQMHKFGSIEQILGMIPGLNIKKDDKEKFSHESEKEFKKINVFIQSMTPAERENPDLINTSRKKRIANGCGIQLHDINLYIKQFEQMREMMGGMGKLQKVFKGFNNNSNKKKLMAKAMGMMKGYKNKF